MNWHTAANPNQTFSQVFNFDGTAVSAPRLINHYDVVQTIPLLCAQYNSFVEVSRNVHKGLPGLSFQINSLDGTHVSKYVEVGVGLKFADGAAFKATALHDNGEIGGFAIAWVSVDGTAGQTVENVRLQIFDYNGVAQTAALIVGQTTQFAEHLALTTMAAWPWDGI